MYLRTCVSAEPITDIVDVLTKPGVPGKVGNPRLWVDEDGVVAKGEKDAVIFNWEAPIKQPGVSLVVSVRKFLVQSSRRAKSKGGRVTEWQNKLILFYDSNCYLSITLQYYAVAWESQETGKVGAINLTADECTLKVRVKEYLNGRSHSFLIIYQNKIEKSCFNVIVQ